MEKNKIISFFIIFSLISALAGGLLGSRLTLSQIPTQTAQKPALPSVQNQKTVYLEESEITGTVEKVSPSVVSIVISKDLPLYRQGIRQFDFDSFFNDPFSFNVPFQQPDTDTDGNIKKERRQIGGGSGFIVSENGLVVTNRHVVTDDEADYTVITNEGEEYKAEILAKDTINDFAVLQMLDEEGNKAKGLPAVVLGDSDSLRIGQKVIAIGNALAEFRNTVTAGIVSGIGRNITARGFQSSESLILPAGPKESVLPFPSMTSKHSSPAWSKTAVSSAPSWECVSCY